MRIFFEKKKGYLYLGILMLLLIGYFYLERQIPRRIYMEASKINVDETYDMGFYTYRIKEATTEAFSQNKKETPVKAICYFASVIPFKEMEVCVVPQKTLLPSGCVVGIYGQSNGVLVLATTGVTKEDKTISYPTKNKIKTGDYITKVNGKDVHTKKEFLHLIENSDGYPMDFEILRGQVYLTERITPVYSTLGKYMIGTWIKDDLAGIGTLTYIDSNGEFGALGHGISDGETGELLHLNKGRIYDASVVGIKKGTSGKPGEIEAVLHYGKEYEKGSVVSNSKCGIFGQLDTVNLEDYTSEPIWLEVAYKQEIKKGKAYLISNISGKYESYEIEIDSVTMEPMEQNKGISYHVTDKRLLEKTGGIVQGMSGSPIVQNGKMIGAVTHVLVNNPTKGYGIFIELMLSTKYDKF